MASALACAWGDALIAGREPASWGIVRRLLADGHAGMLVPSFAHGATADDHNLVLWRWGPGLPHKVTVYDPTGRLPKNQLSWDQRRGRRVDDGLIRCGAGPSFETSLRLPQDEVLFKSTSP